MQPQSQGSISAFLTPSFQIVLPTFLSDLVFQSRHHLAGRNRVGPAGVATGVLDLGNARKPKGKAGLE
ncbi:hypothetical protein CR513_21480, partial [Mucuna pruriens]